MLSAQPCLPSLRFADVLIVLPSPPVALQVPPRYQGPGVQERVRCHAVADSFDRYALQVGAIV